MTHALKKQAIEHLKTTLNIAIKNAQPKQVLAQYLPAPTQGKTWVIGAGKASALMAQTLESLWQGPLEGVVVTPYGYHAPCKQIKVLEAAHPVPDNASLNAAKAIMKIAQQAQAGDQILTLLSGGGSSLLCAPADGLEFSEKQRIHQHLLHSGANIREINCVRRHLSRIKGGHLAQQSAPAQIHNLIISDVPGDNLVDIASGPTVADRSTCAHALAILKRYKIPITHTTEQALKSNIFETPKPKGGQFSHVQSHLIATAQKSLNEAATWSQSMGYKTLILGDAIEGEASEVAKVLAGIAKSIRQYQQPIAPPCIVLSGGETTVTVKGSGIGGPNVEFLLSLLIALDGLPGVYALAADTDGVDGACATAGAWIDSRTLKKAWKKNLVAQDFLDQNNAHHFFSLLKQQIKTGPTHTNVNDFRALLII